MAIIVIDNEVISIVYDILKNVTNPFYCLTMLKVRLFIVMSFFIYNLIVWKNKCAFLLFLQ